MCYQRKYQEDHGNGQCRGDFRLEIITYGGRKAQSQTLWSDSVSYSGWRAQDAHFLSLAYTYRHTTFILRVQYMFFFLEVSVWYILLLFRSGLRCATLFLGWWAEAGKLEATWSGDNSGSSTGEQDRGTWSCQAPALSLSLVVGHGP